MFKYDSTNPSGNMLSPSKPYTFMLSLDKPNFVTAVISEQKVLSTPAPIPGIVPRNFWDKITGMNKLGSGNE